MSVPRKPRVCMFSQLQYAFSANPKIINSQRQLYYPTPCQTMRNTRYAWCRFAIFPALLVAVTAFTCAGMFGTLNGMGAGGGAGPEISNAANATVFGVLAVGSLVIENFINRITPKYAILVGSNPLIMSSNIL